MTTQQTTDYDVPAAYLPRLILWAESQEEQSASVAAAHMQLHSVYDATRASADCAEYRQIAGRARTRLISEYGLTLADVQADGLADLMTAQEPPRTLPGLTDWLVSLLGRFFPGLPREGWQAIACALHVWRPQP